MEWQATTAHAFNFNYVPQGDWKGLTAMLSK